MGGTIDQMADPFTTLMETLFTEASSGLVPQFSLFIAGAICATASIVMAFVAMGLFLVAKVSLALLLAVGPAFIFCAMFPVTQRYAEIGYPARWSPSLPMSLSWRSLPFSRACCGTLVCMC